MRLAAHIRLEFKRHWLGEPFYFSGFHEVCAGRLVFAVVEGDVAWPENGAHQKIAGMTGSTSYSQQKWLPLVGQKAGNLMSHRPAFCMGKLTPNWEGKRGIYRHFGPILGGYSFSREDPRLAGLRLFSGRPGDESAIQVAHIRTRCLQDLGRNMPALADLAINHDVFELHFI